MESRHPVHHVGDAYVSSRTGCVSDWACIQSAKVPTETSALCGSDFVGSAESAVLFVEQVAELVEFHHQIFDIALVRARGTDSLVCKPGASTEKNDYRRDFLELNYLRQGERSRNHTQQEKRTPSLVENAAIA